MFPQKMIFIFLVLMITILSCGKQKADIVLKNGDVYTVEEDQPWARAVVKPKSEERILNEYRTGLRILAEMGIVEMHDMIRSFEQVEWFVKLQKNGELTCRVWVRPWLDLADEIYRHGFIMGMHPESRKRDYFLSTKSPWMRRCGVLP